MNKLQLTFLTKQGGVLPSMLNPTSPLKSFGMGRLTIFSAALFLSACIGEGRPVTPGTTYKPVVVLTFAELRKPISMEEPHGIKKNGKIVLFGDYLMVNEPKVGVHIFDNSDPAAPVAKAFLPILGVTDVVIRNNLLYADSYVDLVVFDISDMDNISLKHRVENTLPPPYSAEKYGVDSTTGIVISLNSAQSNKGAL